MSSATWSFPSSARTPSIGRDEGAFQVFGQAEGFGFAWRPQKWFYPLPKPANITYEPEMRDPPGRYEANDKIELDLRFPPAARFSGTVVDDRGNALAGVRLEIRDCESLTFVDNVRSGLDARRPQRARLGTAVDEDPHHRCRRPVRVHRHARELPVPDRRQGQGFPRPLDPCGDDPRAPAGPRRRARLHGRLQADVDDTRGCADQDGVR